MKKLSIILISMILLFPLVNYGKQKRKNHSTGFLTDSLALVDLYVQCNGENWTNSTNWLQSSLDSWFGVTIEDDRVVALELYSQNLPEKFGITGQLPNSLYAMDELKLLNLSGNLLDMEIPSEIAGLQSLETLILNYTAGGVHGVIPDDFVNLKNLRELGLAYARIEGIPANFSKMNSLERINLIANAASFDLSEITKLNFLKFLFLKFNWFTDIGVLKSKNLEIVNLSMNTFDFEDIVPNLRDDIEFYYSPQKTVVDNNEDFSIAQGDSIRLIANYRYEGVNYQWYKDDIIIEGAQDSVFTCFEEGVYTYHVTNPEAPELEIPSNSKVVNVEYGNDPVVYAALEALYNSTNGDNWINNENWLTDQPFNDWYGIETEIWGDTQIMNIILAQNNLTGYIPPEIGNITNLIKLELFINEIGGEIPSEIGNLKRLTSLCLGDNSITGTIPESLYTMTSLHRLELGLNQLEGEISPLFANLPDLTFLQLEANNLSGVIPEELFTITTLKELNLSEQDFGRELSESILNLVNLEDLFLGRCSFSVIPVMSSMPNLRNVSISQNNLGFEYIIPMLGAFDTFDYNSQGMVDEEEIIDLVSGSTIELQANYLCDGVVYRWQYWYDGRWWDIEGEIGSTLLVNEATDYHYYVTHPLVPGLELESRIKTVVLVADKSAKIPGATNDNLSNLNIDTNSFKVFPMPINDYGYIQFDIKDACRAQVVLYNSAGKLCQNIYMGDVSSGRFVKRFNIQQLPAGYYFIKLVVSDDVKCEKVIIK